MKTVKNQVAKKNLVISEERVFMSGKDLLSHVKANIVEVLVPEFKSYVRCQVPDFKKIYKMRVESATTEEFQQKLFRASLLDLTDEEIDSLETANGLKYFQLFNAVMSNTDLFTSALTADNQKK